MHLRNNAYGKGVPRTLTKSSGIETRMSRMNHFELIYYENHLELNA